ncbi:ATP-binding protein [Streptomyces sp. ICC4]|uniref:sensor histidine kinase n=1 Tax=Streptomyces sp. ICC4 TaxID=2099584 RepID=UPI000DC79F2E|nr:ATP-binding protein [Streptomyces sp. ICC4]AWZ09616.1 hypothetical protein DRB89_40080 [Streptomyces sp. ICC4]
MTALGEAARAGDAEGVRELLREGAEPDAVAARGPPPLGAAVEGAALRAVQGALANVRRHARASAVVVTLTYQACAVSVDVWDDGVGFDPAGRHAGGSAGRDGLRLLRLRVGHLGGRAVVESTPGGGTVVSVRLPVGDPVRGSVGDPVRGLVRGSVRGSVQGSVRDPA